MESFKEFIAESASRGPRIRIIKARIRNGKVQRRKRVSGVKGYSLQGTTLKRINPQERLHRKIGARRAKVKRRAKLARSLLKRARSMRKRKSLGL